MVNCCQWCSITTTVTFHGCVPCSCPLLYCNDCSSTSVACAMWACALVLDMYTYNAKPQLQLRSRSRSSWRFVLVSLGLTTHLLTTVTSLVTLLVARLLSSFLVCYSHSPPSCLLTVCCTNVGEAHPLHTVLQRRCAARPHVVARQRAACCTPAHRLLQLPTVQACAHRCSLE